MELFSKSVSILLAVAFAHELAINSIKLAYAEPFLSHGAGFQGSFLDKCCQIGREKAVESSKFNCKLSAREVLLGLSQSSDRGSQLLASTAESFLGRDQNLSDQCEMVLESCCLAHHRTRNCNSGKQFAKGGSACMDVELSKEATVATESFNDCCMSCSLGILAARTRALNETSTRLSSALNDRCKLISPLASSLSGQLYEQTYIECCRENLPRPASPLNLDPDTKIDCSQAANVCQQRCLPAGSQDQATGRTIGQDRCDCFSGYRLALDGLSCIDIDECKSNLHTCNKQLEICDNTRGSFRCLARSSQHSQHSQQPQGRSLSFDDHSGDPASLSLFAEQPFSSNRLCLPGSRWSTAENRCIMSSTDSSHQQQWKRNAAYSSSSVSSSRRHSRIE